MTPAKPPQLSDQLLLTAEARLRSPSTEADLRRATSDLYYALFHRLCEALVAPLGVDTENRAFRETYQTLYRLPDHGFLERRCKEIGRHGFSTHIKEFARQLVVFKNKRQNADYEPLQTFAISSVRNDLLQVRELMSNMGEVAPDELARFAYFVSLRNKRSDPTNDA